MPNESLIHADIFFFVSTIALVVICIGIAVALFYVIKILRNVREVTDRVKAESAEIVADVKRFRAALKEEGIKWRHVVSLVRSFFSRDAERRAKRAKQSDVTK